MKNALLHTKLQRSHVAPDIVPRDHLLARLAEGRQRPLILISAPAGYGKSTLASRWAQADGTAFGWVSLDSDDNDLHQFLNYLLAAIQDIFPDLSLSTETLLEAQPLPPATILARYLLNDLHGIPEPFTLVLDDYHRITNPRIHDLLSALLEHPAQALRLVLLTRKDPPLPIAGMRGRGLVTEIREADLRLTPTEVAAFMKQLLKVTLDEATAAILESKTEGWAAGLRLAGLYLQGQQDLKLKAEELSGSSTHIAEYLFAEVVSRLNPEMVSYLLETAILDRFCAPLCQQIHQAQGSTEPKVTADQFIRWLLENNLFIIGLDGKGYWYRYHHLFRDLLKAVQQKQRTPGQIADLHRVAGNWFAKNNLIEEALCHLLSSGDTPGAIDEIVNNRYELMNRSQFARLNRLLAMLPESSLVENPLLLTTRAFICIEQGNYVDAHEFTLKAERMLEGSSLDPEVCTMLKNEVLVLHNLMDIFSGTVDSSRFYAQKAFDDLPEHAVFVKAYEIAVTVCFHQMKGHIKKAVSVINDAFSNPIWPPNIKARMYFHLCIVLYMDADLTGVMRTAQMSLRTIRDTPLFHTRAYANYFHGVSLYLQNDTKSAESHLLKLLDDRHTASPSYVAEAAFILSCIYLSQGDETAASEVLDQISTHCRENGHTKIETIVLAFEAEFAMRRGDIRQARQICRHADFNVRTPLWFFYVPQLTPIKCLLDEGTEEALKEAFTGLMDLDERMRPINRTNVRIEILALLAVLHHKRSDDITAVECLLTSLHLAEPSGWIRSFVDLGPPMVALLKSVANSSPESPFAVKVLDACLAQWPDLSPSPLGKGRRSQAYVQGSVDVLTRRETEILPLLAEGMSNKQLAETLCVSDETVKTHLKNMFRKLGAGSRIEALNKAREQGIFIVT